MRKVQISLNSLRTRASTETVASWAGMATARQTSPKTTWTRYCVCRGRTRRDGRQIISLQDCWPSQVHGSRHISISTSKGVLLSPARPAVKITRTTPPASFEYVNLEVNSPARWGTKFSKTSCRIDLRGVELGKQFPSVSGRRSSLVARPGTSSDCFWATLISSC